jgi:predicted nucleotidyltransferase
MNPNDPNVVLLELVARRLGEALREELVFVGGAVAGLLITDPALPAIRPTEDVDLIVQALVLSDYHKIERALTFQGFKQDMSPQAPICRWKVDFVAVDVMPTLEEILGFSNRWYPHALLTADVVALPSGTTIRLIPAAVFVATKLEAFAGRGNNDYLFSHDLGDLLAIIDGRETLIEECRRSDPELKLYLGDKIAQLLATPAFLEALPGHLPGDAASQERVPDLEEKLQQIAALR